MITKRIILIYLGLAALCLSIPWLTPIKESYSESYALGFSNTAFIGCLLLLFIAPNFIYFKFINKSSLEDRNTETTHQYITTEKWLKNTGITCFVLTLIFLISISGNLEGYAEAEYFLLRSTLMTLGKVPYQDFEYCYGPFFLYAITALNWLGLPSSPAEVVLIIFESVIGYLSLFYIITKVFSPYRYAGRLMFFSLLLASCFSTISAGQNYNFLRFATALAFACYIIHNRKNKWDGGYGLLSGPIFLLGWTISPEVGLVIGLSYLIVITLISRNRWLCLSTGIASYALAIFSSQFVLSSFISMFHFSSGMLNFPAFPSFHILLLLISIFLSTLYIANCKPGDHPISWLIFAYSIGLLPSTLGRCDPGHVLFNSFGFIVLSGRFLIDKNSLKKYFEKYCITYSIGYFLIFIISISTLYFIPIGAITGRNIMPLLPASFTSTFIALIPPAYHDKAILFLNRKTEDTELPITKNAAYVLNPRSTLQALKTINTPYFVQGASSTNGFNYLISELSGKTVYIRYGLTEIICQPWRSNYQIMSILFAFPTQIFPQRHHPEVVSKDFCAFLGKAQTISKGNFGGYTEVMMSIAP